MLADVPELLTKLQSSDFLVASKAKGDLEGIITAPNLLKDREGAAVLLAILRKDHATPATTETKAFASAKITSIVVPLMQMDAADDLEEIGVTGGSCNDLLTNHVLPTLLELCADEEISVGPAAAKGVYKIITSLGDSGTHSSGLSRSVLEQIDTFFVPVADEGGNLLRMFTAPAPGEMTARLDQFLRVVDVGLERANEITARKLADRLCDSLPKLIKCLQAKTALLLCPLGMKPGSGDGGDALAFVNYASLVTLLGQHGKRGLAAFDPSLMQLFTSISSIGIDGELSGRNQGCDRQCLCNVALTAILGGCDTAHARPHEYEESDCLMCAPFVVRALGSACAYRDDNVQLLLAQTVTQRSAEVLLRRLVMIFAHAADVDPAYSDCLYFMELAATSPGFLQWMGEAMAELRQHELEVASKRSSSDARTSGGKMQLEEMATRITIVGTLSHMLGISANAMKKASALRFIYFAATAHRSTPAIEKQAAASSPSKSAETGNGEERVCVEDAEDQYMQLLRWMTSQEVFTTLLWPLRNHAEEEPLVALWEALRGIFALPETATHASPVPSTLLRWDFAARAGPSVASFLGGGSSDQGKRVPARVKDARLHAVSAVMSNMRAAKGAAVASAASDTVANNAVANMGAEQYRAVMDRLMSFYTGVPMQGNAASVVDNNASAAASSSNAAGGSASAPAVEAIYL